MKLVAMLGSRRHYFRRYTGPVRRGISMCREHLGRALEAVEKIPSGIFSYRLGECYPRCFYAGSSPCLAGITHITINPLGFIRACPFSDEVLGKWNSGRRKPFSCASSLAEWASDFPESCMRCSEVVSCMGGCRVARRSLRCTRDPLMEGPLQKREGPGGALPGKSLLLSGFIKFCGTVRREKFGFLLMSEDEVVPVTKSGGEVLSLCDGTREIGEIERIAGSRAKDFIVSLGRRGFIDLVIEGDRPQSGRGQ
jgi:radical SAM protein with 4Fe4S-binding SPASM domain